ncbi:DedA family protein [Corynebacterium sanguinis]|uniref:DedA family protein n=1 Tax=Corynebacterium sanguinis TaxID=2594913 RepID=A0A6C1TYN1_9CORY|nr:MULTISPECIES: VTT domain-containing protein [Corynebacterium]MCT1412614.1 VTT domain-containing protein [Corynebacterium sanguinis]MCT1415148.1 VTT domain-containing protein [Corynebacterium sanguinis]MCT1426250.1 VTT domain-containing protein [Corynebacterium sanguinis]MCT1443971.1 VTT domain-containing protein [Corynebacterium sanguinis]MCT1493048.1 VTT domain-containing protein [Corynebacterium sanguinis]
MIDSLISFLENLMQMPIFYPLVTLLIIGDALAPIIPSETVLNLAGAFSASVGVPNPMGVIIAAIIGAIIGDNICFLLGSRLIKVVNRLDPDSKAGTAITWVRRNMKRRAGATIIVARFIPWARWVATIVLGSVGYNWFAFFFYDTIGVIIWALLSVGVGYLGGSLFADWPLLALIVGVTLGSLVGFGIQKLQVRLFEWLDVRRGVSKL